MSWAVTRIIADKVDVNGLPLYLVEWEDCDTCTWLTEDRLDGCREILADYESVSNLKV